MNKTELIAKAKLRLRKMSADTLDEDVEQLINVALADLKRIGVHSSYLDPENITDPLIIEPPWCMQRPILETRRTTAS